MGYLLYSICIFPIAEIIEIFFTILYRVTNSYGAATVGLSFVVTLLTLPIYMVAEHWQDVERKKEMAMAPKVARIKKGFRGDERFMILSAYYREQHYKPYYALRSAFSILIQIPFFMAAYSLLSQMQALRGCSFWFLEDLGKPDGMIRVGGVTLNLLPIAMTLFNCVAGYIYSKGHPLKEKIQIYGMAALFFLILYQSPSGLLLYWTMNNALSLLKNIFYRLKHPLKVLYLLCAGMALVLLGVVRITHTGKPSTQAFLLVGTALVVFIPLEIRIIKTLLATWLSPLVQNPSFSWCMFCASTISLAILLGLVVPSSLVVSSPTEFAFLEPYRSPLAFVFITLLQAVGLCIIWPWCLYRLFDKKIQALFATTAATLFVLALSNLFLFPDHYGSVLVNLHFSDLSALGRTTLGVVVELICIPIICFCILFCIARLQKGMMVHIYCLMEGGIGAFRDGQRG